jgi:hypothetical protein
VLLKLLFLVVFGISLSSSVLVARQQRLAASGEVARSLARAAQHDATLWTVRAKIATRTTPQEVRDLAACLGELKPIPREICEPPPPEPAKASTPLLARHARERSAVSQ